MTEENVKDVVLKNHSNGKRTALIIDEVQNNVDAPIYSYLLRNSPSLIVLSAGVPKLLQSSPGFPNDSKYNPSRILLQMNEIREVAERWLNEASNVGITNCSLDSSLELCTWLLSFTGGMMFPMLMILDHMFTKSVFDEHFNNYRHYLTSCVFFESKACCSIKSRCFDPDTRSLFDKILYNGEYVPSDVDQLENFGYWNSNAVCSERGWFVSDLLLLFVYNSRSDMNFKCSKEVTNTLTTMAVQDKIEAIIIMGLKEMTEVDFMEPSLRDTKMENAVGFCWAHRVRYAFPQLYMTLQTCANYSGITGKPCPTVDFTFVGGCMNVAIELSTNCFDIKNKVKKLVRKGDIRNGKDVRF
mmetsp:Transcript_19514/g.26800  ORF Transcript_19514/g.26800 Transcript_19514/m.26800 type:complete len:356 (-) Transcript_19514:357-1424(-)